MPEREASFSLQMSPSPLFIQGPSGLSWVGPRELLALGPPGTTPRTRLPACPPFPQPPSLQPSCHLWGGCFIVGLGCFFMPVLLR